jgi:hypothetical protein
MPISQGVSPISKWIVDWRCFSVAGPVILTIAYGETQTQRFGTASFLIAVTGIWSIATFLSSPFLSKHRQALAKREIRRNEQRSKEKRLGLVFSILCGCVLLVLLTVAAEIWVNITKLNYERDNVSTHLSIDLSDPGGEHPSLSQITVTNGGDYEISAHQLLCDINLEVDRNHSYAVGPLIYFQRSDKSWGLATPDYQFKKDELQTTPIEPHGDAQSDFCLAVIGFNAGFGCIDVTLQFIYYLTSQPDDRQEKSARLIWKSLAPGLSAQWQKQPKNLSVSPCAEYVK